MVREVEESKLISWNCGIFSSFFQNNDNKKKNLHCHNAKYDTDIKRIRIENRKWPGGYAIPLTLGYRLGKCWNWKFPWTHTHTFLVDLSIIGLQCGWGCGLSPAPWKTGSLPASCWEMKTAESRKMPRLSMHADSQTERSFPLQFFQCHFKLQLPANGRAPCLLTSRTSQFPPAAASVCLFF